MLIPDIKESNPKVLEHYNDRWKEFITNIQDDYEYKLEYLLLSKETKWILNLLSFGNQAWFSGSGVPWKWEGVIACKSHYQDYYLFLSKIDEKLVDFEFQQSDNYGDFIDVIPQDDLKIVKKYMELFDIVDMVNEADENYRK